MGNVSDIVPTMNEFALRLYRNGWTPALNGSDAVKVSVVAVCPVISEPHLLLVNGTEGAPIDIAHRGCRFGHSPRQILRAARRPRPVGYAGAWASRLQQERGTG